MSGEDVYSYRDKTEVGGRGRGYRWTTQPPYTPFYRRSYNRSPVCISYISPDLWGRGVSTVQSHRNLSRFILSGLQNLVLLILWDLPHPSL